VAGRLEWLAPDVLVDCAHNPDGAARLAAWLRDQERTGSRTLLLGASVEKDIRTMAAALAPCVDRVLLTRCSHPRAASPGDLARQLVDMPLPVLPAGPVEEALPAARETAALTVVAGSIFLVGAVRDLLGAT
jgi:dihydrofolate synthase/folylpolyglutamate synthase